MKKRDLFTELTEGFAALSGVRASQTYVRMKLTSSPR